MNQNKKMFSKSIGFRFVIFTALLSVFIIKKVPQTGTEIPVVTLGAPSIYVQQSDLLNSRIDQIADDGQRLYLLSNDHAGIIQVYDIEGNYQYSIAFYTHKNGAFQIAVKDGIFYVRDMHSNLYLFKDGEFVEFLDTNDGEALRRSINFEINSPHYEIRLGSVWKVIGDNETCVIQRPVIFILNFQNHTFWGLGIIIVFCIVYYLAQKKAKTNGA